METKLTDAQEHQARSSKLGWIATLTREAQQKGDQDMASLMDTILFIYNEPDHLYV